MNVSDGLSCPASTIADDQRVTLVHGEGGAAMRRLISQRILPLLGIDASPMEDAVALPNMDGQPVLTTDAFVVSPLFFPGGDIGSLCVYGTVNDLVVRGAEPLWLTLALILEEGLPFETLDRVLVSIASAARSSQVRIVAGDVKVVPRGAADGMFVTTTGLGQLVLPAPPGAAALQVGDALLITGPIGRHGVAILAAREQLGFSPLPESDCAPLGGAARCLREGGVLVRAMRDATRGGLTAVLHEWAGDCGLTLRVDEAALPISADVRGVCELLGLDPLHMANEGTMLVALAKCDAERAVTLLRSTNLFAQATLIGEIRPRGVAPVVVRRLLGREQPLVEPTGAPLPRIC